MEKKEKKFDLYSLEERKIKADELKKIYGGDFCIPSDKPCELTSSGQTLVGGMTIR